MAASIAGISVPTVAPGTAAVGREGHRTRQISPEAGHALEILGHAIDYLVDEHVNEGGSFSGKDPRMEAIQILMARNREIYLACPVAPTMFKRICGFLRHR